MPRDSHDKRRHERHLFLHHIEYRSPHIIADGSIINISESGMCIYTDIRLEEGDDIEILTAPLLRYQKATTRWVVKYNQDLYKIGLAFKSAQVG